MLLVYSVVSAGILWRGKSLVFRGTEIFIAKRIITGKLIITFNIFTIFNFLLASIMS